MRQPKLNGFLAVQDDSFDADLLVLGRLDALRRELPKLLFNDVTEQGVTGAIDQGRAEALVIDLDGASVLVELDDLGLEVLELRFKGLLLVVKLDILLVSREDRFSDEHVVHGVFLSFFVVLVFG